MKSLNNPDRRDFIRVGRISAAHGIQGAVRVISYAGSPDIFIPGTPLTLETSEHGRSTLNIVWAAPHRKGLRIRFEGVNNRLQAEKLIGSDIWIEESRLPELTEGEYYWHDLIGLAVVDKVIGTLGRIVSILTTGSNDVYVVRDEAREVLVPALESVVRDIDLARGRMTVELPEGLLEITQSPVNKE